MIKNDSAIYKCLRQGVDDGVFSGAQAAWCRRGGHDLERASAGSVRSHPLAEPVNRETLFDIASVTKVFASTAAMGLVEKGVLDLDHRLDEYLPVLSETRRGRASLAELLAHEAGFEAWQPFFEGIPPAERGRPFGRQGILDAVLRAPGIAASDMSVYSDLGFIVLMIIMENETSMSLDGIVKEYVTTPLGCEGVHFRPVLHPPKPEGHNIAATENCPWRGRVLEGEVHDDNAWTMGGISAHAGLFATADDVARLGGCWLRDLEEGRWISRELANLAIQKRPKGRGLGWDIKSRSGSAAGELLGPRTFGHLGFTGCSLWVDPEREISIALCTNRVHFGRENLAIRAFRPAFCNVVASVL